jgi:hypothetical protein
MNAGPYLNNVAADLKPEEIQPWAAALRKQRMEDLWKDDPSSFRCLPMGPRGNLLPFLMQKIIQTPTLIAILTEDLTHRQIFMDGRALPVDPNPSFMGYSVGRWEGDTLVVETTQLVEQVDQRFPHSADARVVERFHLTTGTKGERVLVIDMTMTDPRFYTKPVTGQKKWMAVPNGHLLPYDCAEEGWRQRLEQLERRAAGK